MEMMDKSALEEYFPSYKNTLKGEMFFKVSDTPPEEGPFIIKKTIAKKQCIFGECLTWRSIGVLRLRQKEFQSHNPKPRFY